MILIGLGANLDGIYGSPEQCLQKCSKFFSDAGIHIVKLSSIWKSAPVPMSDQPWYRNAVCLVETELNPHELLSELVKIENQAGRTRREVNAARTLDLDILSYNNEVINDAHLTLPHPQMHLRAFVIYPLQEIVPNWIHPTLNKSLDEMIATMPKGQEIKGNA